MANRHTVKTTAIALALLLLLAGCASDQNADGSTTDAANTAAMENESVAQETENTNTAAGTSEMSTSQALTTVKKTTQEATGMQLAKEMNLNDAYQLTQENDAVILIDVRTKEEYDEGHVPGALLHPLNSIEQTIGSVTTDLHAPIILYCRSGNRSGQAQALLQRMGYTNVSNAGGVGDFSGALQTK